jgi:uncharacterized membrane protein
MPSENDVPVDLYVAAYSDLDAAQDDWDGIRQLAKEDLIAVEALVLVSRDADGKIHERDNAHTVGIGGVLGAAGGLLVGLIFPPALLVSTAAGAGVGAGMGGLVSHHEKKEIKAEVANDLPVGSSGIIVMLDERWAADAEKALPRADHLSKHEVDKASVDRAKTQPLPPARRDAEPLVTSPQGG